ncbi:serine hydrolase, partial [Patescibacteria group bacterium]
MALFRKKKEEEEAEEEKTKVTKPRRKKKEPPKPWTKKERYILLFVLVSTVLISGALALSAREWKVAGLPRITIPKISFFDTSPIVIDGDNVSVSEEDKNKANGIKDKFRSDTKDLTGVYGFYLFDLTSGYGFGVDQREVFQAASLIKLPVMAGMYLDAKAGFIDLDSTYTLKEEDKISGSGSLYGEKAGYQISYRDLIKLMGKESDNTAFNITKNYLGDEKIKTAMHEFGMNHTSLEENETTMEDIGIFFKNLYQSRVLSKEDSEQM